MPKSVQFARSRVRPVGYVDKFRITLGSTPWLPDHNLQHRAIVVEIDAIERQRYQPAPAGR